MPKKNIMMDIETFGLGPFSVGIALGAVWFDPTKQGTAAIKATYYSAISPDKQHELGLRIEADTACWWMLPAQRPAYDEWLDTLHVDMPDALLGFTEWIVKLNTVEPYETEMPEKEILMWGNGPQFDNTRVREWYQACRMPVPWGDFTKNPTSNDRCFKTLRSLPGAYDVAPPHEGLEHNALIDARQQAMWLCNINQANSLGLT